MCTYPTPWCPPTISPVGASCARLPQPWLPVANAQLFLPVSASQLTPGPEAFWQHLAQRSSGLAFTRCSAISVLSHFAPQLVFTWCSADLHLSWQLTRRWWILPSPGWLAISRLTSRFETSSAIKFIYCYLFKHKWRRSRLNIIVLFYFKEEHSGSHD